MSSTETRSVDSSLGTPFVRFDQARDSISRSSQRSMSSSRRSSISSRPSHSPRPTSSSVDSNDWLAQYSYSTASSRGPEGFAISTNSIKSSKRLITVALTKDVKGSPFVMRILLDPCCTGTGHISARVADSLGLDIRPATHRGTFTSVGGKFNMIGFVTVPSVMLPVLSQDKTQSHWF